MQQVPFDAYDFFGYLASGLVIVAGMDAAIGFPHVLRQDLKVVDTALLLLGVYIAGQLVAGAAKTVLEDGLVGRILKRPNVNLLRDGRPRLRWFLFPGFYKPLPREIQSRIRKKAHAEHAPEAGEALFLHIRYHAQILDNEKLIAKLGSFLNKYGFARNLAFSSLLVGTALLVKANTLAQVESATLVRYGWTAIVVAVLLFYRYLKFYRQYSYELFNTYGGLK